jgi:hypothetical protein
MSVDPTAIVEALEALGRVDSVLLRAFEAVCRENERLWADHAEMRDEILALSNRIEAAMRASA